MTKKKQSVDWLTIKHFWSVSARFKKDLYLALLVPLPAVGISVGVPYYIGKILGSLANAHADIRGYFIGLVVIGALSVVLNYISFGSLFALQPKVMSYLQEEALTVLLKRSISFHNNRVSGKIVSDAVDYPDAFLLLSNESLIDVAAFLLIIILGVVLVSIHSLLMGFVLLVMAALAIGSAFWYRKRMGPYRVRRQKAGKAVISHLSDAIVNHTTVKTFGNENLELKTHRKLAGILEKIRAHDWHLIAVDGAARILALLIFQVVFIVVVLHAVHHNPALIGTGIFAFSYTITITNRLFQVGTMMRQIEEALLKAMPTTEMLQEEIEIQDLPHAEELQVTAGGIELSDLSFHYSDTTADHDVFEHLNLSIRPGQKVGLVGPSGGGKSTLTRLLLRFEDIQSGGISIDGQNIAEVTQTSLRRNIAYVPQEPLLFHRTIAENISYGKMDADKAAIQRAAELSYAHDFIMELPNGYDTIVGERGVKLSGGQRQRIAIARAILKDAPILVLDEATAALDSESEVVIQKALNELMENRTTIVIAHRLSTIQRMDRIIVLNHGAIDEQGTHDELIAKGGLYAKLWKHQSGGFLQD